MSGERYTLDTNILFYAVDGESAGRHAVARDVVRAAYGSNCVITLQCLSELYNAVARKKPQHLKAAVEQIRLLSRTLTVVRSSPVDLFAAMRQHRSRPVHFWDAMLWATAKRHGCATVLTENLPDQPVVDGIRYLNPFDPSRASELAAFI